MTILAKLQEACTVIGLAVPATVFGSTLREHVELQALANEMALRMAKVHDWTVLKTLATITGDGTSTAFPLPTDYRAMLKKAALRPTASPYYKLTHEPDTDRFLQLQLVNIKPTFGWWTLIGSSVNIQPAPAAAATIKYFYLTNQIVKPASGGNKTAFSMDTDTFLLDEETLKLGIIWQWRANKGLLYNEDMNNYEDALASAIGGDKGSNILTMSSGRRLTAETYAFPGVLG